MTVFPAFLKVDETDRVLVVGGGTLAWHKVRILCRFGLGIDLIAEEVKPELLAFAEKISDQSPKTKKQIDRDMVETTVEKDSDIGVYDSQMKRSSIRIWKKSFEESDLFKENYVFVIAATNQREVNAWISACCKEAGILVNVVDDPKNCTFVFPAMVKRGDLVCGVSTGGACPVVSQIIKGEIEELLPEHIDDMIRKLEEYREQIREEMPDHKKRAGAIRQEYLRLRDDRSGLER